MKKGGRGGARTHTGLIFEERVSLKKLFGRLPGYDVSKAHGEAGFQVRYEGRLVARLLAKHDFYRYLDENGVAWDKVISKKLLPDDALLVIIRDTLFIVESKFQEVAGSVDEKLQTCDFKRKQYSRLVRPLKLRVEYIYVLNDWFKKPQYKDTLCYIESVNCHYMFNEIPLSWFGLPNPSDLVR